MKYALAFALFALVLAWAGWELGGAGYGLLWPALSFLVIAAGYLGLGPKVFGKREEDGLIGPLLWLLHLPFHAMMWVVWSLQGRLSSEALKHEVVPGLWIGRRPRLEDLPEDVGLVVDLTAEFTRHKSLEGLWEAGRYRCLATLDAGPPDLDRFGELVEELALSPDVLYVHCASGHGRSATVVAAVLVAKGQAASVEEAVAMMQKKRPGVGLSGGQVALLGEWAARESQRF